MLTLMILGQAPTVDSVLKRFDQFLSRADTLSVTTKSKVNGRSISVASVRIDRPGKMNITAKFSGQEALFILNERGGLEIDRASATYAEHPNIGELYLPRFKLHGGMRYVVPASLVRGSSRGMFFNELQKTVTPKVSVNGTTADLITGKMKNQMAEVEIKAWIDSAGRLVKFYTRSVSMEGTSVVEQDMSGYAVNQKFPDTAFATRFPISYSPFELSHADSGLPQGVPVPNVKLRAVDGGRTDGLKDLMAGKNTMVLIADPDFHANAALLQSIRDISSKIPDFKLVVVSNRRDVASAKRIGVPGIYFDPTGRELDKLQIPGAPTMFLVNKKGVLTQMFFGFDGTWENLDKIIERLKG